MIENMKIGMRLALGFSLVLFLMLVVGIAGYWGVKVSTGTTIEMLEGDAKVAEHAALARAAILNLRRYEKEVFLTIGKEEKQAMHLQQWKETHQTLVSELAILEKYAVQQKDKEAVATMKKQLLSYDYGFNTVVAQMLEKTVRNVDQVQGAIAEFELDIQALESSANTFASDSNVRMASKQEMMKSLATRTTIILVISILLAIAASIAIGFFITRSIVTPLNAAVKVADRLAKGDLTVEVEARGRNELGQLMGATHKMVENLRRMIGRIRDASSQVASAADQISSSSEQLARSAQSQAEAAEETSGTMVEMAASIQNVAANSNDLATNVNDVSASIQELGASSEEMARSSEVMAGSVTETSTTIEEMTVSIEKVAQNAEDLSSSVSETSSTIEEMTVSIEQVANNSQDLRQ
ncbi:MAG TPA: methyl-accepting chemotaxis protein, partial [Geobacterales bacterium]|nr:methyl-accepting chemotaxis protein [Geobacterales bacterium]